MRKIFILCLIMILGGQAFRVMAQKEGAVWYFGNHAGLDFNLHYPRPLTDGKIDTREGVATICDKDGNLLFYTDGQTVWNRNHQPMVNGENLLGDVSSTQSSIIVPKPGPAPVTQYYIFTVDKIGNYGLPRNGLNYSMVDLLLNAPGGRVTEKNKPLLNSSTEKITAIKHADDESYWIVAHGWNNNSFHIFLLNRQGISPFRVINAGSVHENTDPDDKHNRGATGYMKSSPKGDFLALAVEGLKSFELFSFDNSNADIRLLANLPAGSRENPQSAQYAAYGVEFSPTGNYLYGSTRVGGTIYQWDITKPDQATIRNSIKFIREKPGTLCGALQLAFNGKIYVTLSGQQYLGVINSPIQSDCNYKELGASLLNNDTGEGGKAWFGLPTFLPDFFRAAEFYYENTCFNDETIFYLSTMFGLAGAPTWDIYDETGTVKYGSASVDQETFIGSYTFPGPGKYLVKMTVDQGGTVVHPDTVNIHPLPELNFPDTTSLCKGTSVVLDAGSGAFYAWKDNPNLNLDRYRTIYVPGNFFVTVQHYNGCFNSDSTRVVEVPPPTVGVPVITKAACGEANGSITIVMDGSPGEYEYQWTNFPDNHSHQALNLTGGVYEVEITSKDTGCSVKTKFTVSEEDAPEVTITSSAAKPVCPGTPVTLTAAGANNYLWQDTTGVATATMTVIPYKSGSYSVKGYSQGSGGNDCSSYATITVEVHTVQKPQLGHDRTGCTGEVFNFDGGDIYQEWSWSTGENTRNIVVSGSIDQLILMVRDKNGCPSADTARVTINPLPVVDLGRDLIVCKGTPVQLDAGEADRYEWNTGDTTRYLDVTETGIYSVNIERLRCPGSDDVTIRVNNSDAFRVDSVITRDISCTGAADGRLQIFARGEGSYYEYSIDGGLSFQANQGLYENLEPDNPFRIVITEDSVCTFNYPDDIILTEPDPVKIDYRPVSPGCDQCLDGEIILEITGGTPPYSIRWATMDTLPRLRNIGLGVYPVIVTDAHGCSDGTMIELTVAEETKFIPNAFTPNGDGINERWEISFLEDKPDSRVIIYDRSGRKIWESEPGYPTPWDGRGPDGNIVAVGSYFYIIRLSADFKPLTGTITILK